MNLKKTTLFLFGAAILHAFSLSAQTEQGPTLMSQLNSDFYVGPQSGAHSFPTIQSAITKTCALPGLGSRVIIPAGSPADGTSGFTISAVAGGCAKVAIIDQRAQPATTCSWGGSSYACSSGGTGGGGLSGQTPNFLPKATSSASSTSPSIVEDTGTGIIIHGTGTPSLLPNTGNPFMVLGNTIPAGKNTGANGFTICGNIAANGTPCTTSTNQFYYQSTRSPGGDTIIPRHLDVEIQSGYENGNTGVGEEFEAERLTYNQQSPGQAGGVSSRFIKSTALGDLIPDTLLLQGTGCNRGEDECLEPHREFVGFLNPNFGGHVVKGTTFSTSDQPLQITAGFGGYTTTNPGVDMILVDASKRVNAGNVINTATVDSGSLVEVTLDTPHSFGVSTKTALTFPIDSPVYTGSCPNVTNTGVLYPTTGPYAHVGDAFSTQENGTGLGTINGNYVNDTTNTLIGYCIRFNAVAVAPPAGTIMHITNPEAVTEFVTVIASGTTWATAFVHHQHPAGSIVTWGGGVGQGFGMTADEIAPGTISRGYDFFGEGPQTSISKLVYPIAYTRDSTHVAFDAGGAEWRTRGFPSVTPITPMTPTLTQSGGVVNSISQSVNDYAAQPRIPGTSQELPPPAYTVAGCAVPPVLKFSLARVSGLSYNASIVSGGSGCTGTPTVTLLPPANPAYFAPIAWIRSVVDPASCSTSYPFACSSTDGYVLADSGAKQFTNGDEILESLSSGRYLTDKYSESGDPIVANSGRTGPEHLHTHAWSQSGAPYQTDVDTIPSEFVYGSFANDWTPDPNIPRSTSWNPGPYLELAGVQNQYYDMLPPTAGGPTGGLFKDISPPGLNMGAYKFTFDCILHPFQTGTVDHPCLHGQYFPFGLAFNKIGPFQSGIYVNPADGTWHTTRGFTADGVLSGSMLTLPPSFPDLPNPASLGLQNRNNYTVFSKSTTTSAFGSDAQVSAGEYTAGLIHAGANNPSLGVFPSWGSGSIGSTTYAYVVTSVTGEGETTGSTTGFVGGPASLDPVTNFIIVKGIFTGGSQGGNVYRTSSTTGGIGFICSFTNGPGNPQCADTGQAANAARQPPTVDTSGSFSIANSQKMKGVQGLGTKVASFTGTATPNDIVSLDANGTPHDSGVPVGGGGGGGSSQSASGSAQFGLHAYGDSVTAGVGATAIPGTTYVSDMQNDFVWAGVSNFGVSGASVLDITSSAFTNENPGVSGNPIYTWLSGINDESVIGTTPGAIQESAVLYAGATWTSLASINKVLASNAAVTKTGAWTLDTTYANANGESSATNGNTISFPFIAQNNTVFLWYRIFGSGGTFSCTIDGVTATDTISSSTVLAAQGLGFPTIPGGNFSVRAARFITTVGSHTLACQVTSTTGSGNTVSILGIGITPEKKYRGKTAPNAYVGGVIYQQGDASSAASAAVDAINKAVAVQLLADGLNVHFVDVRQYINFGVDMANVATQGCPASTNPGFHPNDCGHRQIANAFEDVISPTTEAIAAPTVTQALNYTSPAPTSMGAGGGFNNITPHNFFDPLINGLQMCNGMSCGIKQIALGGNFGWANFVQTGKHMWNCFEPGAPTNDNQFSCPFEFKEDGTMSSTKLSVVFSTPATSSATCTAGQIWADAGFVYVCTAANTIKRAALSTF